MTGYDIPHTADVQPLAYNGTVLAWQITMEDGYWVRHTSFPENVWKTVTMVYPNENIEDYTVCAEADLPEGAEKCGIPTTPPDVEVMAEETKLRIEAENEANLQAELDRD